MGHLQLAGIKVITSEEMPHDRVALGHFVTEGRPKVSFLPHPDDPLSVTVAMEMPKFRFVGAVFDISRS